MSRFHLWTMESILKPSVDEGLARDLTSGPCSDQGIWSKRWNGHAAILLHYTSREDILEDIKGTGHLEDVALRHQF